LGNHLVGNSIVLPDGATVELSIFEHLFAAAIAAGGTYADFAEADGGTRGYAEFFALLRDEGLLS